jgi:hypothetical protein
LRLKDVAASGAKGLLADGGPLLVGIFSALVARRFFRLAFVRPEAG